MLNAHQTYTNLEKNQNNVPSNNNIDCVMFAGSNYQEALDNDCQPSTLLYKSARNIRTQKLINTLQQGDYPIINQGVGGDKEGQDHVSNEFIAYKATICRHTSVFHISDTCVQTLERISYEMKISNHHSHKALPEELQIFKIILATGAHIFVRIFINKYSASKSKYMFIIYIIFKHLLITKTSRMLSGKGSVANLEPCNMTR